MKQKTPKSIIYLVVAPDSRQNEVIKVFMDTFSGTYTCDVFRAVFPIKSIFCYIYLNDSKGVATLRIYDKPPLKVQHDLELTIYQDISTIPLIHPAIKASKCYAE